MKEIWRAVVGAEGRYEVSSFGRVRSLDRVFIRLDTRVSPPRDVTTRMRGRLLRAAVLRSGHLCVVIGRGNTRLVHQLVAESFIGPRPSGHEVLHLDHDPANNRASNLRWGTRSENLKMDYAAGRRPAPTWLRGARWRPRGELNGVRP